MAECPSSPRHVSPRESETRPDWACVTLGRLCATRIFWVTGRETDRGCFQANILLITAKKAEKGPRRECGPWCEEKSHIIHNCEQKNNTLNSLYRWNKQVELGGPLKSFPNWNVDLSLVPKVMSDYWVGHMSAWIPHVITQMPAGVCEQHKRWTLIHGIMLKYYYLSWSSGTLPAA